MEFVYLEHQIICKTLQWSHNGLDSVSNHQPHHCLLSRLFRRRSKKTSKLGVTGLCARNSPGTGEFPAQMASNPENVSIWWSHYEIKIIYGLLYIMIFSCDQAAIWLVHSVCLSVRPSVCPSVTPFSPCSHHRIIMTFSGFITNDKSDVHAKGQGQRSNFKVTEVNTQLNRFRTVTPVWIHIWWWNDAYSLMMLRRGALLFLKVIRQISRSHGSKKRRIWPRLGVSGL